MIQIVGQNARGNYQVARRLKSASPDPWRADAHIHQVFEQPQLNLNVDRVKAGQMGLTQRDVTSSMLISLSGNNQVAPSFWLNPTTGISYNVGVQTSQYRLDSLDELLRTPVTAATSTVAETTPVAAGGSGRKRRSVVAKRRFAGVWQPGSDTMGQFSSCRVSSM